MSILRKKHGGAHGSTHEKQQPTITAARGQGNKNPRSLLLDKTAVGNVLHLQDGGQLPGLSESHLQQLLVSEQNLAAIKTETTVTPSPEWIKSALDQLGPVFTVSTARIDDKQSISEVSVGNLTTHGSGGIGVYHPVQAVSPGTTSISASKLSNVNVGKSSKLTKVLPKSNALVSTTRGTSLGGGRDESSNCQQVAVLDDLQDVPIMRITDKEILPNVKLELCDMDEEQAGAMITPQELALLPDKPLGFEESVSSKSTLEDTASELDNFVSSIGSDELDNELAYLEQEGVGNVNLDFFKNSKNAATSGIKTENGSSDAPMATISISTDKNTNTTQILINTGHGQQLFQINTADLAQATTALEPLALQGGMVGFDNNGQVLNTGTVSGITVQDGYLLIPVSQTEGESGVLLQTTALQKEEGDGSGDGSGAKKLYICEEEGCGKVFEKVSKLKVHHMQHTGERPFKCSVPGCDWAFMTAYKLKRHVESHEKKKDFVCRIDDCGRKFTTIYNLKTHLKLHERPKTEKCDLCGEMFPTVRKLDSHLVTSHKDAERLFSCTEQGCDKRFFSSHLLQAHLKVHLKKRDLVCQFEGCGKVFDKQCRLKQHMRTHTGEKPYFCNAEDCGWAFATASKLKRHQRKHTGERKWTCPHPDCEKSFMRAEHLKGHLVTHTGEKPFPCTVPGCEARFAAKSSMYVHVKKHEQQIREGKVTYICPMEGCERKYNNKNSLRQHISRHYQDTISQVQNMGIMPIIQTAELQESLIAAGVSDVATTVPSAAGMTTSADGSTSINPTDLINVGGQTSSSTSASTSDLVTNQAALTQFIVSNELTQQQQQHLQSLQLSHNPRSLLANNAFLTQNAGVVTSSTSGVDSKPVITITPGEMDSTEVLQGTSGGSARTDAYSNRLLSDRARRRRKLLREKADLSSAGICDEVLTAAAEYPTSEMSRGLPIRDPDTGALYVQTQLLQDDPPYADMYTDEQSCEQAGAGVDSCGANRDNSALCDVENPSLSSVDGTAVVSSMDHSGLSSDLSLEVPPDLEPNAADFTESTIDLHDLT